MTTGADIVRVAEEVRQAGLIYRTNGQYSGYVSIQQAAPYSGSNDRFGRMHVHHCGISVAYVYHRAGLRFGEDYPGTIQHSIPLSRDLLAGYDHGEPGPGWCGVVDHRGGGWGNFAASDHVVLIVENHGDRMKVWETNVTPDGRAHYGWYPRSRFTAWGRPKTLDAPAAPQPRRFVPFTTEDEEEDMLIIDVPGRPPLGVVAGVIFPIMDASVGGDVRRCSMSEGVFLDLYGRYCAANRLNPLTGAAV